METCAREIFQRTEAAWRQERSFSHKTVLLVTDLYSDTSSTYRRSSSERSAAAAWLEGSLFSGHALPPSKTAAPRRSLDANAATSSRRATAPRRSDANVTARRRLARAVGVHRSPLNDLLGRNSSTKTAVYEQLLCAGATTLVMCKSEHGCSCGRGMDSGFTNAIVSYRIHELQKPTTCNIKGGIYNFDAGPCHSGPAVSTGWPPDARKTGHWHWETGIRRVPRTGGLAS